MLAAYGFKGRVTSIIQLILVVIVNECIAIGVDLGTTFSVVGVRMGKDVFIIEDEDKHTLFPSVVSYLDNGGAYIFLTYILVSNCAVDIIVGRSAVAMLESHPQNTIFNSKRFIGRKYVFTYTSPIHLSYVCTVGMRILFNNTVKHIPIP